VRVGIFRPVVRRLDEADPVIELLRARIACEIPYEASAGVTDDDVHTDPAGAIEEIVAVPCARARLRRGADRRNGLDGRRGGDELRGRDLFVEGPIQYDAAVDVSVARTKLPSSDVAGRATVFVFPDLNTGNPTYKAVQRSAGALAVGPVLQGLRKPVNELSRGASVRDIVNTVAITAIQAQVSPVASR
jgi:hypothetical protein